MDAEKRSYKRPVIILFFLICLFIVQVGLLKHQTVTFLENSSPMVGEQISVLGQSGLNIVNQPLDKNGTLSLGFMGPSNWLHFVIGDVKSGRQKSYSMKFSHWGDYEVNFISEDEHELTRYLNVLGFRFTYEKTYVRELSDEQVKDLEKLMVD